MENIFLPLCKTEYRGAGFDASSLQANRTVAMASLGWEQ